MYLILSSSSLLRLVIVIIIICNCMGPAACADSFSSPFYLSFFVCASDFIAFRPLPQRMPLRKYLLNDDKMMRFFFFSSRHWHFIICGANKGRFIPSVVKSQNELLKVCKYDGKALCTFLPL